MPYTIVASQGHHGVHSPSVGVDQLLDGVHACRFREIGTMLTKNGNASGAVFSCERTSLLRNLSRFGVLGRRGGGAVAEPLRVRRRQAPRLRQAAGLREVEFGGTPPLITTSGTTFAVLHLEDGDFGILCGRPCRTPPCWWRQ